MGRSKALLDFDGRCTLELVLAACRQGGAARPIVVVAPGEDTLLARASGCVVAVNHQRDQGQTSSLQAGLRHLPPDPD